ncbi:MAG: flagellar basal body rod protein FlgC [Candidatus Abyssobacteria bacterium SURF_17]|uniref:Flagellar basal-body rod protein FlgC n=1 Tax=Candidatus Abyssobacteria bacterium SURF_17 TaxID=2093361 RepID=A0A419F4Z9_9BACT|nr:MAG: flagellar basal body rod protein FlgC [Candidatus Abyssubacteria bacterium SURF_17]
MQILSALDISATGLYAERTRMNVIANNLANVNSTRTPEGGPFRRQFVVLRGAEITDASSTGSVGVKVVGVVDDPSAFPLVYNPGHPDANADGYVAMPNVNVVEEMVDMMTAVRAYEANITAIDATKGMVRRSLDIIRE